MAECVALFGGHICDEDQQGHQSSHHCECGATWNDEGGED